MLCWWVMLRERSWLAVGGAVVTLAVAMTLQATTPPPEALAKKNPIPQARRVPVIVELFTSEGCDSCPPADELLSSFDRDQPIPGVEIIAMEEHVDYWDDAAWRDPYSSRALTTRQNDYGRQFRIDDIYTPQAVINGQFQVLGSDPRLVRDAITRAAKGAKATVDVEFQSVSVARVKVDHIPADAGLCDVMLAVTENKLVTSVTGGENRGRKLLHTGVVRSLVSLGRITPDSPASYTMHLRFKPNWKRDNLKYVVLVQDRASRKILGATAVTP
ncbi:MAG: DUF1223 domain-containing protein [Bryobacteraceae bacterium]